jgi:hypothetical protein
MNKIVLHFVADIGYTLAVWYFDNKDTAGYHPLIQQMKHREGIVQVLEYLYQRRSVERTSLGRGIERCEVRMDPGSHARIKTVRVTIQTMRLKSEERSQRNKLAPAASKIQKSHWLVVTYSPGHSFDPQNMCCQLPTDREAVVEGLRSSKAAKLPNGLKTHPLSKAYLLPNRVENVSMECLTAIVAPHEFPGSVCDVR